jgi:hypothetical protein
MSYKITPPVMGVLLVKKVLVLVHTYTHMIYAYLCCLGVGCAVVAQDDA